MSTTNNWIDFRELRAALDFAQVLEHYGVELKRRKRDQGQAFCPLPGHKGRGDGKKHSPSFSVNLARKCFRCFSCGQHGGVIDFALLMERKDPRDADAVREVALKLQEQFLGASDTSPPPRKLRKSSASTAPKRPDESIDENDDSEAQQKPSEGSARPVIVNAPLDFRLKLDIEHPYLKQRGFTQETISTFGLGYCPRGVMATRIAIPLHNHSCELVGYAGRLVDDAKIGAENPKYLFPAARERDGKEYRFSKSHLLFNAHRISAPVYDLIVVEGFFSAFWLWQLGFHDVVALMGCSCSVEQAWQMAGLVAADGRVWIIPDRDEAGERCAHSVLTQVAWQRCCRWIKLDSGQPTDHSVDVLGELLDGVVRHV